MANDKSFKIKNGLKAGRYLGSNGTDGSGSEGYSLAGASYDSVSFSVASQAGYPTSIVFNPDGTKMYVSDDTSNSVYQYTLSTGFDLSTASYASKSLSVSSQDTSPFGLALNNDGTKMYVLGDSSNTVYQYTLSTAYDLSTASYASLSFSVSSQDSVPTEIAFNNDGTKMYIVGASNDSIFQYSLSTAFNVSTASYDNVSFSVSSQDSAPYGFVFNGDGTKMYLFGDTNDNVFQYSLSTAFNLSTASYDSVSFNVSSEDSGGFGIAFNNDGTKLYLAGASNEVLYQYSTVGYTQTLDLATGGTFSFTPSGATTVSFSNPPASGTATGFALEVVNTGGYTITWPSSVKWHLGAAPTATATKELYTFVTTDGGTTYYGKLAGSDIA